MERESVELKAGARKLGRAAVLRVRVTAPGLVKTAKVYYNETDHGHSSVWFSIYHRQIIIYVDRATDGLYRLRRVHSGKKRSVRTTNYVNWPELAELFNFLFKRRAK